MLEFKSLIIKLFYVICLIHAVRYKNFEHENSKPILEKLWKMKLNVLKTYEEMYKDEWKINPM
jgi:hypothetical protein